MKHEKLFLSQFKNSLPEVGCFYHKIKDAPPLGGKMRFDAPKPFDSFMVWRGISCAIEAKYTNGYQSFGRKDLRPCQVEGLNKASAAGSAAIVLLNVKVKREFTRMLWFDWNRLPQSMGHQEIRQLDYSQGIRTQIGLDKNGKPKKDIRFDLMKFLLFVENCPRQAFYLGSNSAHSFASAQVAKLK